MFSAFVKVPRSRFPVWISLASASALATSGRGGAAFADLFFGRAGFGGAGRCLAESCFEDAPQNTACNRCAGVRPTLGTPCLSDAGLLENLGHRTFDDATDELVNYF
jgi:hypothetical protein